MKIVVLGAGAWGTAMAMSAAAHAVGHDVTLWARDAQQAAGMQVARSNQRYLPGLAFPPSLRVQAGDARALADQAELVIIGTPMAALRGMLLAGALSLAENGFGTLLSTTDNQRLRAYSAALSVALTAIAAFALVPRHGLAGAVWAHVLSRVIATTMISATVTVLFKLHLPYAEILRLVAAASCGAGGALLVALVSAGPIGQIVAGVVYASVYCVMTLALRAWHSRDLEAVAMVTGGIPLLSRLPSRMQRWVRPPAASG